MMAIKRAIEEGPTGRRLASNVSSLRKARGLNQPQLAERMTQAGRFMHASGVSKIEQLDRRVDVDDLVALAVALGVSPNRLLLPAEADDSDTELTPSVIVPAVLAWEWATGEHPLLYDRSGGAPDDILGQLLTMAADKLSDDALNAFRRENRPNDPGEAHYLDMRELRKHPELVRQAAMFVRTARQAGVSSSVVHDFIELALMTSINGHVQQDDSQ